MLEDLIVYAAVGCAGLYSGWRLLPAAARFSLAERAATLAQGLGLAKTDPDAVRRRAAARARSACGGCSGCAGKTGPQPVLFINRKDS
ncbi:hypothetical protein [Accumulibacter sp.]|uniref:hypothetical protein n=1 Tax=Accumulibacter sp. TaxID=2053492 RepID=UPI0035ADBA5E